MPRHSLPLPTIRAVAERQLCCGCGACAGVHPNAIRMVDDFDQGRRPLVADTPAGRTADAAAVELCPGIGLSHDAARVPRDASRELLRDWGPLLEVWEGHAADEALRWGGSSGGAASALALFAIERAGMHAVLHTAARRDAPYLNETVVSCSREELLERTGSRYAPASPADGLHRLLDAPGSSVFIGKPCDVAAVQSAARLDPRFGRQVGLTIAFFCAGVPSTTGTLALLRDMGVEDPARVVSLRYRGNGWPGRFTVRFRDADGAVQERSRSYEESWGFLTRFKQWRCNVCPDHTGEFADIAVGDPWYRPVEEGEAGKSLIVPRTERGREFLRAAADAGYVRLERMDLSLLPRSQPNLLDVRGHVWGRLLALRLAGVPRPRFDGMAMAHVWLRRLGLRDKLRSIAGTWRRIAARGLRAPRPVTETARSGREAAPVVAGAPREGGQA